MCHRRQGRDAATWLLSDWACVTSLARKMDLSNCPYLQKVTAITISPEQHAWMLRTNFPYEKYLPGGRLDRFTQLLAKMERGLELEWEETEEFRAMTDLVQVEVLLEGMPGLAQCFEGLLLRWGASLLRDSDQPVTGLQKQCRELITELTYGQMRKVMDEDEQRVPLLQEGSKSKADDEIKDKEEAEQNNEKEDDDDDDSSPELLQEAALALLALNWPSGQAVGAKGRRECNETSSSARRTPPPDAQQDQIPTPKKELSLDQYFGAIIAE